MSVLDDLAEIVVDVGDILELQAQEVARIVEPSTDDLVETAEVLDGAFADPTGEFVNEITAGEALNGVEDILEIVLGVPSRTIERDTIEGIRAADRIDLDNYTLLYTEIQGSTTEDLVLVLVIILLLDKFDIELIDPVDQFLVQFFSVAAIDNVYGRQIEGFLSEGIDPIIKQDAHRESRTKQADFQDFVEANLRQKATDPDIDPRDEPVGEGIRDLLHPNDLGFLAEPEEYGTRPGQEGLYELDALKVNEPEEIIEEPIQYGIPVPLRPVEQITALAGQPEDVKEIYRQVIDQLPKSENLIQDYVRLTEFTFRLREKVQEGAITPSTAISVLKPELKDLIVNALPDDRYRPEDRTADEVVDLLSEELGRNFALLDSIPADPPTFSDIERAYREGVISVNRYKQLYDEFGPQQFFFREKVIVQDIRTGADDIARQESLGRLTTAEATAKLERIGFTGAQAAEILVGADPDEIVARTQESRETPDALPVGKAPEIGDTRSAVLTQIGIATVADVAEASVEDLTAVTSMTNEEAERAIRGSQRIVELTI